MNFLRRNPPRSFTLITVYVNGVPNMVYSGLAAIRTTMAGVRFVRLPDVARDFPELPRSIPVEVLTDDNHTNVNRYSFDTLSLLKAAMPARVSL